MYKRILLLSLPYIISNLTIPLASSVDIAFVGHLKDPSYLGGVALGTVLFNFIYFSLNFLRMGTTAIVAKLNGEKDKANIAKCLFQNIQLSLFIGISVVALGPLIILGLQYSNIDTEILKNTEIYFQIRIYAVPFALLSMVLQGWLIGMQNSLSPFLITLFINIINIVCTYFFITHLKWNIEGAAYGTLIAQVLGFVFSLTLIYYQYSKLLLRFFTFKWNKVLSKKIFSLSKDLFFRTLMIMSVFSFMKYKASEMGSIAVGTIAIMVEIIIFIAFFIDGFAYAAEGIIGKYFGEKNIVAIKKNVKALHILGSGMGVVFVIILYFFYDAILRIYSNHQEVIDLSKDLKFWMLLIPLASCTCYIWDGIYLGLNKAKQMKISVSLGFIAFFISWGASPFFNNSETESLLIGLFFFMASRSIAQSLFPLHTKFYSRLLH